MSDPAEDNGQAADEINEYIQSQNDTPESDHQHPTAYTHHDERRLIDDDTQSLQYWHRLSHDQNASLLNATNVQAANPPGHNSDTNQYTYDQTHTATPAAQLQPPSLGQRTGPLDPAVAAALMIAIPDPAIQPAHRGNNSHPQPHLIDMFSFGNYLGRTDLPMALISQVPNILAQGNRIPITGCLVLPSTAINTSSLSPTSSFVATTSTSNKRPVDSDTTPDRNTNPRVQSTEQNARHSGKDKGSKRDWSKATPRPTGTTKLETDTCLTCIQYNKKCSGTTFIDGKCEPCSGHGEKKTSKRKCYHQDSSKGIKTYDDARAKDPTSYRLPQNTKRARAQRGTNSTAPSIVDHSSSESDSQVSTTGQDQDANLDPRLFEDAGDDASFNDE